MMDACGADASEMIDLSQEDCQTTDPPQFTSPTKSTSICEDVRWIVSKLVQCTTADHNHFDRNYFFPLMESLGETVDDPFERACVQFGLELVSEKIDPQYQRNNLSLSLENQLFKCPMCDLFKSDCITDIFQHLRMPHRVRYRALRCNFCGLVISSRREMLNHCLCKHRISPIMPPPLRTFSCPYCPYEVSSRQSFNKHQEKCKLQRHLTNSTLDNHQAIDPKDQFNLSTNLAYPTLNKILRNSIEIGTLNGSIVPARSNMPIQFSNLTQRKPATSMHELHCTADRTVRSFELKPKLDNYSIRQSTNLTHSRNEQCAMTAVNDPLSQSSLHGACSLVPFNYCVSNQSTNRSNENKDSFLNCPFPFHMVPDTSSFVQTSTTSLLSGSFRHYPYEHCAETNPMNYTQPVPPTASHFPHFSKESSSFLNTRITNNKTIADDALLSIAQLKEIFRERSVNEEIDLIVQTLSGLDTGINWYTDTKVSEVRYVPGRCALCDEISFISDLILHYRIVHRLWIKNFQNNRVCIICSVILPDIRTLLMHQQIVHQMVPMCSTERIIQFHLCITPLSNPITSTPATTCSAVSQSKRKKQQPSSEASLSILAIDHGPQVRTPSLSSAIHPDLSRYLVFPNSVVPSKISHYPKTLVSDNVAEPLISTQNNTHLNNSACKSLEMDVEEYDKEQPHNSFDIDSRKHFFCKKCGHHGFDLDELRKHLLEVHSVELRVTQACEICGLRLIKGEPFNSHCRGHLEQRAAVVIERLDLFKCLKNLEKGFVYESSTIEDVSNLKRKQSEMAANDNVVASECFSDADQSHQGFTDRTVSKNEKTLHRRTLKMFNKSNRRHKRARQSRLSSQTFPIEEIIID